MSPTRRLAALRDAAFNTARLPARAVVCDLSTDVLAFAEGRAAAGEGAGEGGWRRLDAAVAATLGDFDVTVTPRGRVAEARIVRALVGSKRVVLANEVYVTGAWSIRREGARVVTLPGTIVARPGRGPIESLDLDAAARLLSRESVACLWLTTPRVLLSDHGGAALDLENLRKLAALRDSVAPEVPIVVDATKIGEWAARSGAPPGVALRALAGLAEVLVLSARKDLGGVPRGLLLRRSGGSSSGDQMDMFFCRAWAGEARHLDALARGVEGLAATPATRRWSALDDVAAELLRRGAPLVGWGGGALFLDAAASLPAVPADQSPAPTLLAHLYLRAGIRGLGTPVGASGRALVRLSVRERGPWLARHLPELLADLQTWPSGLVPTGAAAPGPFLDPLAPVDAGLWEEPTAPLNAPTTAGPATLGGSGGDRFAAALHRRLGVGADERELVVQPLYCPSARLAEVWRRVVGDAAAVRGDPQLAAAAATWPSLAEGGSVGDLWVVSAAELDEALAARRTGDVVALRVGGRHDLRPRVDTLEPDVWVIPPGVLAAGAGALVIRPGGSLRGALAASVLFAEGAPGIGGVDPDVLAAMTDALESTDGASAR